MRISDWSSDVCSSDLWHGGWSRWEPLETVARGYPTCSVHVGSGADTLTGAVYAVLNATGGCMLHVPSVTAAFTPPRASPLGALGGILASRMLAMRSEARRVGTTCVSTCRFWWAPSHY